MSSDCVLKQRGQRWVWLACGLLTLCYVSLIIYKAYFNIGSDFATFYESASALNQNKPVYHPVPWFHYHAHPEQTFSHESGISLSENLNPPFVAWLLKPIVQWGYQVGYLLWSVFNLALLWILLGVWLRRVRLATIDSRSFPIRLLGLLVFYPMFQSMVYGQFGFVVLSLTLLLWCCVRSERPIASGLVLALAGNIKLFFGLFLVYFCFRKQWRTVFTTLFAGAALLALSICLTSWSDFKTYLKVIQEVTWYGASANASLYGFLTRLFGGSINVPLVHAPWLSRLLYHLGVGGLLWGLYAALKRTQTLPLAQRVDFDFALLALLLLLISPLGWVYYFGLLYLPYYVVVFYLERLPSQRHWGIFGALAGSVLLAGWPYVLITREVHVSPHALVGTYSGGFYGLAVLGVALWRLLQLDLASVTATPAKSLSTVRRVLLGLCLLPSGLGIVAVLPGIVWSTWHMVGG